MSTRNVECLRCGNSRTVEETRSHRVSPAECPRCGYLGWAPSNDLDESMRRRLRERPPERRGHLYAII